MECSHYSHDPLVTGVEIAAALFAPAQALATRARSATGIIPIRGANGSIRQER
jgi:hypothetical protein